MELEQLKKFAAMVSLYDHVGSISMHEIESIETIGKMADNQNYQAIDDVYNEDEFETAEELMLEMFGVALGSLNDLADKYGYETY